MIKRIFSLVLAICLCLAMIPAMGIEAKATIPSRIDNFNYTYVPHPDPVECMLRIAYAQEGRTGAQFRYDGNWCAQFVSDCAVLAGQSWAIPSNSSCTSLKKILLNQAGAIPVDRNDVQPGDLCFFDEIKSDDHLNHIEIVCWGSGDQIYTIGGNTGGTGGYLASKVKTPSPVNWNKYEEITFVRPAYRYNADAVDLGATFDAVILNTAVWKPIAVDSKGGVHLETEVGDAKELWRFVRNDSGYYPGSYSILSMETGAALEIKDGNITPGTPLVATDGYWGGAYQTWFISRSNGGYVLRSAHYPNENLVLDLENTNNADGTNINIYPRNNSAAQNLTLYRDSAVKLTTPTLKITPGTSSTSTTFTWNNVYGESGYSVMIWKDQNLQTIQHKKEGIKATQYQVTLPAGTYWAYVTAENHFDFKHSNQICFTVEQGDLLPEYTISYNANGGSGAPASQTKMFGLRQILSSQIPVRDGYQFLGWATTKNATSAVYQPGDYYEEDKNITLYAVWKSTGCQHSYTSTYVEETCTEVAHTLYTCTKCGYSYRSGSLYEPLGHYGGTATCKDKAICNKCGQTYGNTDPKNHAGGTEVRNAKAATCTEAGYTGDTHCKGCGVKTASGTSTQTVGHTVNTEVRNAKAATCTEAGYTGDTHCKGCGVKTASGSAVKELGHTGGTATCKDKATCTRCKQTYGEKNAANHTGGTEVRGKKNATCGETGYTGDTYCLGCDKVIAYGKEIAATSHNDISTVIAPTYAETGYTEHLCTNCGHSYKDTYTPKLIMPKRITIKAATSASSGKPVISWTKLEGDVTYKVYRATSSSGKYSLKGEVTDDSFEDTSASVGKKYYYKVKATADGKTTDYSSYKYATCKLAAPVIKTSVSSTIGKVKVSWSKVSSAKKYEVYRATSTGSFKKLTTTTSTSYTDASASVGTNYRYRVKAIASKSTYNSSYSATLTAKRICAQPDLEVEISSTGKPYLSWDKVSGAKVYKVYRAESQNGEYTLVKTTTSTSYTDKTAQFDKDYWYQVDVVGSKTGTDNDTDAAVKVHTTCAKPSVSITISSKKPKVSWKPVEGATKYYVYRATSKSGKYTKVATVTGTSYTDNRAKKGKTYYYKVKVIAANTAANSAYSSVKSIKSK